MAPDSPSPAARTREPSLTPTGMRTSTLRAWPPCLIDDPPRRAVIRLFERQLDFVLDVAALLRARRAPAAPRAPRARAAAAAEERAEEIRERILVPEQLVHLLFGHGAVAAAAPPMLMFQAPPPGAAEPPNRARRRGTPGPAAAPVRTAASWRPSSSYFRRLSGSPSTSYASLISLNRASADLSPGIDVGMVLARQLPVRLLDFLVRRRLRDAERLRNNP